MAGQPTAPAPVSWRDGIHITGTPLWCDALRTRDVCFLSSPNAHDRLIGLHRDHASEKSQTEELQHIDEALEKLA